MAMGALRITHNWMEDVIHHIIEKDYKRPERFRAVS